MKFFIIKYKFNYFKIQNKFLISNKINSVMLNK
jgi:hypothetical protein